VRRGDCRRSFLKGLCEPLHLLRKLRFSSENGGWSNAREDVLNHWDTRIPEAAHPHPTLCMRMHCTTQTPPPTHTHAIHLPRFLFPGLLFLVLPRPQLPTSSSTKRERRGGGSAHLVSMRGQSMYSWNLPCPSYTPGEYSRNKVLTLQPPQPPSPSVLQLHHLYCDFTMQPRSHPTTYPSPSCFSDVVSDKVFFPLRILEKNNPF
jgi:hypothetical protein